MSDQHKALPNSQLHPPKDFEPANSATQGWKDERSQWVFEPRFELPPVLNIVDNTVAPPTEVDGDIYLTDNTGASHADWDGAAANSWVRFNTADDSWNEVLAIEGMILYDKTSNNLFKYTGAAWVQTGGGGQVDSVTGTASRITISGTAVDPIVDISASYVGQTSITTLGTVTAGTWSATTIAVAKGGTGLTAIAKGSVLVANAANVLSVLSGATDGDVLTYSSGTDTISWAAAGGGGNILDTDGLTMLLDKTHTITNSTTLLFKNSDGSPQNVFLINALTGTNKATVKVYGDFLVDTDAGVNSFVVNRLSGNVSVSGGGDFIVNSSQLIVDGSTGRVAIGAASFAAASKLTIDGSDAVSDTLVLRKSGAYRIVMGHNAGGSLLWMYDASSAVSLAIHGNKFGFGMNTPNSLTNIKAKMHIQGTGTGDEAIPLRVDTSSINNALLVNSSGNTSMAGTLDVTGVYKAGGTSGIAAFTGAVASITIKNGIVTAIS